jgi:hypothetical protein
VTRRPPGFSACQARQRHRLVIIEMVEDTVGQHEVVCARLRKVGRIDPRAMERAAILPSAARLLDVGRAEVEALVTDAERKARQHVGRSAADVEDSIFLARAHVLLHVGCLTRLIED